MTWIDLGSPVPLEATNQYKPYSWPSVVTEYLIAPDSLALPSIERIIAERRTRRIFAKLDREQLSNFFWLSCRTIAKGDDHIGFPITQRPTPSAGAIHPIHIIMGDQQDCWHRYDPDQHCISQLGDNRSVLTGLWLAINEVVEPGGASALIFIAEPAKTYAKYKSADSLIWRDAGALVGHMALVAEALGLNFCPLGITGEPWVSKLDDQLHLVGVGVALLGARVDT